jgi:hypothetical protein
MNMNINVVYQIESPNLPGTLYIGSSINMKQRWDTGHNNINTGRCSSTILMLAGGAFITAIEVVAPSASLIKHDLEDRETFHILRLRAEGMTVVNNYLPGSGRRAGTHSGLKNTPLQCEYCDRTVLRRNIMQHRRTKRCQSFQASVIGSVLVID